MGYALNLRWITNYNKLYQHGVTSTPLFKRRHACLAILLPKLWLLFAHKSSTSNIFPLYSNGPSMCILGCKNLLHYSPMPPFLRAKVCTHSMVGSNKVLERRNHSGGSRIFERGFQFQLDKNASSVWVEDQKKKRKRSLTFILLSQQYFTFITGWFLIKLL